MFFKKKKKFLEADNTAVFTTTFVIHDKRLITYVTHEEEDGAWQFFSQDEFENYEDVAMIVSLKEIIAVDASLVELADMPVGYSASRGERDEPWIITRK